MKFKKIIIITSLITLMSFFSTVVLSCVNKEKNGKQMIENSQYKVNNFKPLDFNIFKKNGKDEPLFLGSINYTAYTQGVSFILNILRGLGWNWEDAEKIRKLYDNDFNFNSINIMKTKSGFENRKASVFEKEFENYFNSKGDFYNYKSLGDFIETIIKKNLVVSKLYNQIKSLEYVNKNFNEKDIKDDLNKDQLSKVDASTKIEVPLPGFKNLTKTKEKLKMIAEKLNDEKIIKKIFQGKKYAYSWSGEYLSKLGFQIQEDKIIFWHMSDNLPEIIDNIDYIRNLDSKIQKLVNKKELKDEEQKNLSQVALDPLGVYLPLPKRSFFTNLNLKNFKNQKDIEIMSKWFDKNLSENNKNKVGYHNSFIDGKNPGSVILKMFVSKFDHNITVDSKYPLRTHNTKNRIQTFNKLKDKERMNNIIELIFSFIQFAREEYQKKVNFVQNFKKFFSPFLLSFSEFIANNKITKDDIREQFYNYNNGSHYMLAVEIFLRGMVNIPNKLLINHNIHEGVRIFLDSRPQKRIKKEIVGMSNVNNLFAIMFMFFSATPIDNKINPKNPYYFYHFDPSISDYYKFTDKNEKIQENHFLKDLKKSQKKGGKYWLN